MEIYLIRHTTPALSPGLIYGRLEVALTEDFEKEFETIKTQLPADFDQVYSSPATRCTLLAGKIAPAFTTDLRLAELDFGDWEGKAWDTVDQNDLQKWMDDFVNCRVPGGESMIDLQQRVSTFWNELIETKLQRIAIVTHAGVIRMLLTIYRGTMLADFFKIEVKYGAVIVITPEK
ncbi:alpha-ribazole phosphatase [Dyadobacter sp. Leaf189]|uniref:alpha-ribazole phosphatase n=1 Tax=Dyadobacter sp. Leaf189 TaxID=1736295 RepID=UPI0006FFF9E9|nr:alpha-ribazole phosphatase [Dyadobacter sp. Leaf189]KQS30921.1 alpha-ribazole phosphatase [Dyadobacter sp. Leaf189]